MTMQREHRTECVLAILADADGPLTPRSVEGRLRALGHNLVGHASARYHLEKLVGRGLAECYAETFDGCYPGRFYWPTSLGRREAETLEASRIEGL